MAKETAAYRDRHLTRALAGVGQVCRDMGSAHLGVTHQCWTMVLYALCDIARSIELQREHEKQDTLEGD